MDWLVDLNSWIRTFYSQKIVDEQLGSSRTSNETTSDVVNDVSADELGFWLAVCKLSG